MVGLFRKGPTTHMANNYFNRGSDTMKVLQEFTPM